MGRMVDGTWTTEWYKPDAKGRFVRPDTVFRDRVAPEDVEAGRFHLYVAHACPWAHRTLIVRKLRGLEDAIGVSFVHPDMLSEGWELRDDPAWGSTADPIGSHTRLHQVYAAADPHYTGRVTVPVLWDQARGTIVNNESREIIRMLDTVFEPLATGRSFALEDEHKAIDEVIDAIYEPINNGVYRCGFARTQGAYVEAATELFAALGRWDQVLGSQRYLLGDHITEADWCLFTTLLRFDSVYHGHFKCNLRRIADYAHLSGCLRELYQVPGVRETVNMASIRRHYYYSHETVNPARIVPLGPIVDLDAPHGREAAGRRYHPGEPSP